MYSYLSFIPGLLILIIYWCAKFASKMGIIPEYTPSVIITFLSILAIIFCIICIVANIIYTVKLKKQIRIKAIDYYRAKYGKELIYYYLDLEYDGFLFMRVYTGKGTFYLNNDKSKFLKLYLNCDFEVYRLYDYIEHDVVTEDIDFMLKTTKEKYPAIYRTRLDTMSCINNFYLYSKNIQEYLDNYSAVVILTVLHYIENDNDDFDYQSYCDDFSKDVYSSITSNLDGINPFVEFIFFKKEPMYNNPLILDITSNNHCCYGSMQCNIVENIKGCTYTSICNKKYYCCIID